MHAIPVFLARLKTAETAQAARRLSSSLQQRYPVNIDEFRRILPEAERSPDFCLAKQTADIQNHKLAVIALCKFISASVAREADRESHIDSGDMEGFLKYFEQRVSREDFPFYHSLKGYLSSTWSDFARQGSFLFTRTGHQEASDFLFSFSKGLREACRDFMEVHPPDVHTHHLGHAAVALEIIFESDILFSLQTSGRFSRQEAEGIRDAGKTHPAPPPATYL